MVGKAAVFEYFIDDELDMVDFKGRSIIDIGANMGDTPLYFAKMGCSNILGFEPVKELYEIAKENIKYNPNYENKIQLVNKAVGGKRGKISIETSSAKGYVDDESYRVDVITIRDVLNEYEITPDILKMDCEGCKFEIILNSDLSMFNDIIFEHHSVMTGIGHDVLVEKLEKQNFKIDCYEVNVTSAPFEDVGIIHAYK